MYLLQQVDDVFSSTCFTKIVGNSYSEPKRLLLKFAKSMKVYLTLFYVCICSLVFGQEKSLMWEISGNGLTEASYLYGTMHIADKRIFQFGDSVMIAFKGCKAYAGEIIIDKEAARSTARNILMPGDTTLTMLIGDTGLAKVKKKLKGKLLLFSGMVNKIKPFFTLGLISEGSFKHDKSASLDEYFQKLAKKEKIGLIGIETIAEQMSAIDKIPLHVQAEMLLYEVNNPSEQTKLDAQEMINTYLSQDITKLHDYLEDESSPDELNKYVLEDRNFVMADRIEKFIQFQPTFIGIGAAHLAGSKGLIQLLRQKGFTLRAVAVPFKS